MDMHAPEAVGEGTRDRSAFEARVTTPHLVLTGVVEVAQA